MKVEIQGGTYDDEFHAYYDVRGIRVPSITQVLHLQGLTDYSGVKPEVLENAARRGTEVHALAAALNRYGEIDETWITEETAPYFSAYKRFLTESGFQVYPAWIETPIITEIRGFKIGLTPDCYGKMGKWPAVVELKCTAKEMPSWSIQTAAQELGILRSRVCGQARRFALILRKNGSYRLVEHTEHSEDEQQLFGALRNVWWRINHGQNLWPLVGGA